MKRLNPLLLGILGCLALAAGAAFWAIGLLDSGQSYRSPLANDPPAPGEALGEPLTSRLVIVLIDALRLDTSLDSEVMPTLTDLRDRGASATMHSRPPSFSAPGWTTILTGAWPEINDGQLFNPPDNDSVRAFTQDDFFAAAGRRGLRTAVSGYTWFEGMLSDSAVNAGFYTPDEDAAADREVVDTALPWLQSGDFQLVLIHLDQVDYAGHHEGGPRDPNWNAAAGRADALLSEIVATLDLEQDTLIVLSDHGQIDRGGHGGPEQVTLIEPFVMLGVGVRPGTYPDIDMVDVAPTVAVLLGTNIPATSQGRPLTDMLVISTAQETGLRSSLAAQQADLAQAYEAALGQPVFAGQAEPVTLAGAAMDQARNAIQARARIWRFPLALCLSLLPITIIVRRKNIQVLWFAGGAILYTLLFNLRYAVLEGRTYSLASIDSLEWFFAFTVATASLALVFGWLVPMFGLGIFKQTPRRAAQASLAYVWMTLYLLALPVLLSFAINGALITQSLPEFYTVYLALLSLAQAIVVATFGILLTGVGALIARLVAPAREADQREHA
ncbi:MAG: alkaline phosphatase family protein [Anaerolineales bacterium]|nr:alkaline phosphatase family protein [Anaerolineales bacterium]